MLLLQENSPKMTKSFTGPEDLNNMVGGVKILNKMIENCINIDQEKQSLTQEVAETVEPVMVSKLLVTIIHHYHFTGICIFLSQTVSYKQKLRSFLKAMKYSITYSIFEKCILGYISSDIMWNYQALLLFD